MQSAAQQDSAQQRQFLAVISSTAPIAYKLVQLSALLATDFRLQVDTMIPSVGRTPLQFCVERLDDEGIEIIQVLLPHADLSNSDSPRISPFSLLIPVPWGKKDIFFLLLDCLRDEQRQWLILRSAASAKSDISRILTERLVMMQWEMTAQAEAIQDVIL